MNAITYEATKKCIKLTKVFKESINKLFAFIYLKVFILLLVNSSLFGSSQLTENQNSQKKALIYGVTGQDGYYLAEFLLSKNYEVHGVRRRSSTSNTSRIDSLCEFGQNYNPNFFLHYGDLCDESSVYNLIGSINPDEIYNLGAQSHVKVSFELPLYTLDTDALGVARILEAIRLLGLQDQVKFYQASTSEMFGLVADKKAQNEDTKFHPRSPYGAAKVCAYWLTKNYREAYGMFACNGILFNHESPLREESFVTRKITLAACRYKLGLQKKLYIGNLESKRDWGYAKDYVEAMWLMLQQDNPDDYVIATGETHSVREFIELAYAELGIKVEWHGFGVSEYGVDAKTGEIIIQVDPQFYRPSEVEFLLGDASKAMEKFNWKPKTGFKELLRIMIESDFKLLTGNKISSRLMEYP